MTALDEGFKQAMCEALACCSRDSSRPVLNGAFIDVTTDRAAHYLAGTDGRHLYVCNSFQFSLPESLIVPSRRFITWPGFMNDGDWKLRVAPKTQGKEQGDEQPAWFEITSDRWSYQARSIAGKFPSWKQVLPTTDATWTEINLAANAMDAVLDALPMLPGAEDRISR